MIGDMDTLMGKDKPGKVGWLRDNGIKVDGVQIISLANDMLPVNLIHYPDKVLALLEKISDLERVSVALLCWPLLKTVEDGKAVDVAASTLLDADLFAYALSICSALQKLHDQAGIEVDISYHSMLTVPRLLIEAGIMKRGINFSYEEEKRQEFQRFLKFHDIKDVGINIENEPTTSDANANLIHNGNRLWTEVVHELPKGWGITADLQHAAMALYWIQRDNFDDLSEGLRRFIPYFHSHFYNKDEMGFGFHPEEIEQTIKGMGSWERQFQALEEVKGTVTFHVSQMTDPFYHLSPPIDFENFVLMNWQAILNYIKALDKKREGNIWYAVEIDGGHKFPEGYEQDLKAFKYLQEHFD